MEKHKSVKKALKKNLRSVLRFSFRAQAGTMLSIHILVLPLLVLKPLKS